MSITNTLPAVVGVLLLAWAVSARRSAIDAVLIGLTGLMAIYIGVGPSVGLPYTFLYSELILALLGLGMLVRSFWTPLGRGHRITYRLSGCAVLVPLILVMALVALFAVGSGHDRSRETTSTNSTAPK